MSLRVLVVLGLLSVSCAGATGPSDQLTPSVGLDSTFERVSIRDSTAFAYEVKDAKDPTGATIYSVFVMNREQNARRTIGGMRMDTGRARFELRFNAGPRNHVARDGYAPNGELIEMAPSAEGYPSENSYRSDHATAGTAWSGRTDADHVEVDADFVFPSGSVHGMVVATICR